MQFLWQINSLLSKGQRRRLLLLQGYFVLSAVLQVAGVASVAPFIAVVSNASLIHEYPIAQCIYDAMGFTSDRQFMIAFAWALMGIIVIGNAVIAGGVWLTIAYARHLGVDLQSEVLRGYLHREYERVGRTNSARLVATFTQGISRFVYMVVQPMLNLNSAVFVAVLILGGLVWLSPMIALSAGVVVGAGYFIMYSLAKGLLEKHGTLAWKASKTRYRLLTESLGGIKEIKLLGCEPEYENRVDMASRSALRSETVVGLLGELPRYVLEAIAFCALLGLGIVLLTRATDPREIVSVLSIYAMAGYRLLPAAQTIFRSAAQMRSNADIVAELLPDVLEGRAIPSTSITAPTASSLPAGDIAFTDVSYTYPGADGPAVRGISLRIRSEAVTAIVGSSGAGKSTVADILLGLLHPSAGIVTVGGVDVRTDMAGWRRSMGYVPQTIFLLDDTVRANIAFDGRDHVDDVQVHRAAQQANFHDFIEKLPGGYDFVVGERGALLSGGQRQRVGIARALYRDARILIMDEATSALDSVTEREIIDTLSALKHQKTVVMIAHRLSTIRCADHILVIDDGKLLDQGSFDDLIERSAPFRQLVAAADMDGTIRAA
jgi:ABC-type multidrug transport system fused ATPase/permease subunit